jgi:hypothetical protein
MGARSAGAQVTAMEDAELKRLVIGLVTQIYFANRDGRDPYDPEVAAGLTALVQDLTTQQLEWSVELPRTLEEFRAVINECIQEAAARVGSRAYSALAYVISLFSELALYAERSSPDIDVAEFLRQAGLRAASGE